MKQQKNQKEFTHHIIQIVNTKNPKTITKLVELVKEKYPVSTKEIVENVLRLQKQQKIKLIQEETITSSTLNSYLSSPNSYWYWLTLILAITTTTIVLFSPESSIPFVYFRYILGSFFTLFLPGYTLIKALFPSKELDNLEIVALSVGMSLALVPVAVLILNYTPWGIKSETITLSLLSITTVFATIGIIREHQTTLQQQNL